MALFDGAAQGGGLLAGLQKTADNFSITPSPLEGVNLQDPASLGVAAQNAVKAGDFELAKKLTTMAQAATSQQHSAASAARAAQDHQTQVDQAAETDAVHTDTVQHLRDINTPQMTVLADKLAAGLIQVEDVSAYVLDYDAARKAAENTAAEMDHRDKTRKHETSSYAAAATSLTKAGENTAAKMQTREMMAGIAGLDPIIKAQFLNTDLDFSNAEIQARYTYGIRDSEEFKEEARKGKVINDQSDAFVAAIPSPVLREHYGKKLSEGLNGQTPAYAAVYLQQQTENYKRDLNGQDQLWVDSVPIDRKYTDQFLGELAATSNTEGGGGGFWNTVSLGAIGEGKTAADWPYSQAVSQLMADYIGSYQAAAGVPNGRAQREASELFMEAFNFQAAALEKAGLPPTPTLLSLQTAMTGELDEILATKGAAD
jgi:hypothetical protein